MVLSLGVGGQPLFDPATALPFRATVLCFRGGFQTLVLGFKRGDWSRAGAGPDGFGVCVHDSWHWTACA